MLTVFYQEPKKGKNVTMNTMFPYIIWQKNILVGLVIVKACQCFN